MKEKGCIHIYCGDGKGKTTAAAGLALRAAGNGFRVYFVQFLKDGTSGEAGILKTLPGVVWNVGFPVKKFTFQMNEEELEQTRKACRKLLEQTASRLKEFDVAVLDEVLYALRTGLLEEGQVLEFLKNRPEHTEVVLTGNYLTSALEDAADYVTEMKKIRHPYDRGTAARKGIER